MTSEDIKEIALLKSLSNNNALTFRDAIMIIMMLMIFWLIYDRKHMQNQIQFRYIPKEKNNQMKYLTYY